MNASQGRAKKEAYRKRNAGAGLAPLNGASDKQVAYAASMRKTHLTDVESHYQRILKSVAEDREAVKILARVRSRARRGPVAEGQQARYWLDSVGDGNLLMRAMASLRKSGKVQDNAAASKLMQMLKIR